jgi:two-component system, sensor histidine kinase
MAVPVPGASASTGLYVSDPIVYAPRFLSKASTSAGNDAAAPAASIEDELLRLLTRQSLRTPFAIFVACGIIAAFAADYVPWYAWGGWLAFVVVVFVTRSVTLSRLLAMDSLNAASKLKVATALSLMSGIAQGSSILFFPYFTVLERAIQSTIIVGLCTGAVGTTAGYRPIFLAHFIPTYLPMLPLWAISPGLETRGWEQWALALLLTLYGGLLLGLARDASRTFRESFEIRSQQQKLNAQLSVALAEAESASRAKTRFLASASHDLRQPIHTLSLFSAALSMQKLDSKTREIASHMNVALETLASQLDALLDISKLDAGVMEKNVTVFELKSMLMRLEQEFRPLCEGKDLRMEYGDFVGQQSVETDALLLERIIRNLLSNAVKYTDAGAVYMTARMHAGQLYLRISDTGRGIPESEQARVFEEFYQLDNPERDRSKGLGLGLAIVRRLATMLDIELTIQSAPGQGTSFDLRLPCARSTPQAAHKPSSDPEPPSEALRVLVIDDEQAVRIGMQTLLSAMGYRVALADSTDSAIAQTRLIPPQLVLADLRLRGADNGIAAVQAIRKLVPGVPALLISGDIAPHRLKDAKRAGIKLLHKPVALQDLRQSIREVCEGKS